MEIWEALGQGLTLLLEPHRMMLLWGGVLCGLALGILPGIGGVAGTALLLPFTYNMDPAAAMALLLGGADGQAPSAPGGEGHGWGDRLLDPHGGQADLQRRQLRCNATVIGRYCRRLWRRSLKTYRK